MIDDYHPDLRRIARFVPTGSFTPRTLPLARRVNALRGAAGPRDVEVVPLDSGAGAAVRVHRPPAPASPSGALLWIHGGCYVLGSARTDDKLCKRFAQKLGSASRRVPQLLRKPMRRTALSAYRMTIHPRDEIGWAATPMV